MQTFRKALPLLMLLAAVPALFHQQQNIKSVQAQTTPFDCSYTFTFTTNATQTGQDNRPTSHPCIAFRVTYSTTGTLTATVAFQTSPDNITFTSVPNAICSGGQQPPCLTDGVNPTASARTGSMAVRAYDAWTRIVTAGAAGSGTGTVVVYGYKGTSASAGGSSAGGSSLIFVASDPTGACTVGIPNEQNTTTGTQFACVGPPGLNNGTWMLILASSQGGQLIYFLTPTASDVATYLLADVTLPIAKTTLSFPTLAAGTDTLRNWATAVGQPGLTSIPQGTFTEHLHALRTGGGTVTLFAQFWEVTSAGVDIAMIGQTESTGALGITEVQYDIEFVTSAPYIMATSASRVVSRLFAVVSGSLPTVQVFVGDGSDSHLALPSNAVNTTNFVPYVGATTNVNLGPHSLSTGSIGGASGSITLSGSTSGSATIQAAAAQGTPNAIQPPLTTGASGQVLSTDGGNPQQLSWLTPTAPLSGLTTNTIPKATSASTLGSSNLSDSGAAITTGVQIFMLSGAGGGSWLATAGLEVRGSTGTYSWSPAASGAAAPDTGFSRIGIATVAVGNGTAQNAGGNIEAAAHIATGAVPGISGCSANTQTGANTAGTFTSQTTGTCTVVLTFLFTSPVGWNCAVSNRTTANLIRQSASSATTATIVGVTVTGDVISFSCMGY